MFQEEAEVNRSTKIAFFKAICKNNLEEVRNHLKDKVLVDVQLDSKTLSTWCDFCLDLKNLDYDLQKNLYGTHAVPASWSVTALHLAVKLGDKETILSLINKGVDVNATMECGVTPLMVAALFACVDEINILVENGARVNTCTSWKKTALHYAVQSKKLSAVKALIKHKADVNLADVKKVTPLHKAAEMGSTDIMMLLMRKDAAVYLEASNGATPMHFAVANGHADVLKTMIEFGVKIDHLTKAGVLDLSMFPCLSEYMRTYRSKMVTPYLTKHVEYIKNEDLCPDGIHVISREEMIENFGRMDYYSFF